VLRVLGHALTLVGERRGTDACVVRRGTTLRAVTLLASRDASVRVPPAGSRTRRLLGWSVAALVATHWLRLLPLGFEAPGATRYEDFVDLLTPYAVAGPALAALALVGATRRSWGLALLGATAFTQGHGIHLSANSIRHAVGAPAPVDLWDERVGHWIWFVGLTALTAAVAQAVAADVPAGRAGPPLAALVGLTWAANVVEAGSVPLGVLLAGGLVVQGWRLRATPTGRLLLLAFGLALALVAAWGAWWGGLPQPSELGWLSRPFTR
jgi:hypothetical protein